MAKYNNQGFVGLDQPISSITQPPTVPFQDTVDKYFILIYGWCRWNGLWKIRSRSKRIHAQLSSRQP